MSYLVPAKTFNFKHVFLYFLFLSMLAGCNLDLRDPISWDTDILTPIATSNIGILDILNDSSTVYEGGDQLLYLVYADTLQSIQIGDLLEIPDTTLRFFFDLKTFELAGQEFKQSITLGQLARSLQEQGNILGEIILLNHGATLPLIPDLNGLSTGSVAIDASEFFEFADLSQGDLQISIINELPVDLLNLEFQLQNNQRGDLLISDNYPQISSGDSLSRLYDLSGKVFESNINAAILNLDVKGKELVPIDTAAEIVFKLKVDNLKAREATAIFPSQTVDSLQSEIVYAFGSPFEEVKLSKVVLKSGSIEANVISTFEDSIRFFYSLTNVTRQGSNPSINGRLEPAPIDKAFIYQQVEPMNGFNMDLSLGGTTYNTIQQFYKVDLVYSGKVVTIDLQDSLKLDVQIKDAIPSYVEGYFGRDVLSFKGSVTVGGLSEINYRRFSLADPMVSLKFANSLGVDFSGRINELRLRNTETEEVENLQSQLLNQAINILGPDLPDTSSIIVSEISFNKKNSNIKSMLDLNPNEVSYDFSFAYNENANPFAFENFASSQSRVYGIIEVEFPLEGIIEGLEFQDTVSIDLDNSGSFDDINNAEFKLQFSNEFPFQIIVDAIILDEGGFPLVKLLDQNEIKAGILNNNGRVENGASSEIAVPIDKKTIDLILSNGALIVFNYQISSIPLGRDVKVFSDYKIAAKLIGSFNYRIN